MKVLQFIAGTVATLIVVLFVDGVALAAWTHLGVPTGHIAFWTLAGITLTLGGLVWVTRLFLAAVHPGVPTAPAAPLDTAPHFAPSLDEWIARERAEGR